MSGYNYKLMEKEEKEFLRTIDPDHYNTVEDLASTGLSLNTIKALHPEIPENIVDFLYMNVNLY